MSKYRPCIEGFEDRAVPAVTSTLKNGILNVVGDAKANVIQLTTDQATGNVVLTAGGKVQSFAGVQSVRVDGRDGDDYISAQGLTVPAHLLGGKGNDFLFGGTANDVLDGGDGNDILDGDLGDDVHLGGRGNDRIASTAGNDVLNGGPGRDTLYDIVGNNQVIDVDGEQDLLIVNANARSVTVNDPFDTVAVFRARAVGISLEDGVLYFTADPLVDSKATLTESNGILTAVYSDANGVTQARTFSRSDVRFVGFLGGAGNDSFINDSTVPSVAYGAGGDDLLLGGSGDDILKGGGGNDRVFGRGGNDDLAGNGGNDVVDGGAGANALRLDAADAFVKGRKDVAVGVPSLWLSNRR